MPAQPSLRRHLLHEPLLHFLVVGAVLFAGYLLLQPRTDDREATNRIVVTAGDLRQMSVAWLAQGRPPPTPEQMRSLVESWIRDEILVREALALGLDKNDIIVKRRLAQKMEFLAEDLSDLRDPTRAELEAWFQKHADRFVRPPRATFRHLYFSPDRRGDQAREAAERALAKLSGRPADAPEAARLSDPFMLQDYYPDRAPDQVAKDFGPGFARALFQLAPGAWHGPIESGFGWHLVFVDSLTPARVPELDEVEADVQNAWVDEQRAEFKRKAFDRMRSRYVVVVPEDLTPPQIGAGGASAGGAP